MPARAKLSPLPSSTEVSARRTVNAGIVMLEVEVSGTDTAPTVVSSLTSGRTRRLRWLASITVGVKARLTPKLLNSTEIVGKPPVELAAPEIGTGNSPPARKLAVWPDIA